MLMIQNQLVGSAIGQKITLECQSEAYPKSINYWMKNETIITKGKAREHKECEKMYFNLSRVGAGFFLPIHIFLC
jgi:hypothetical protein